MTKKSFLSFVLLTILLAGNISYSQSVNSKFSINAFAGEIIPVGKMGNYNGNSFTLGLEGNYKIYENLSISANFAYSNLNPYRGTFTETSIPYTDIYQITTGLKPQIYKTGKFTFYSVLEGGVYLLNRRTLSDETNSQTLFGANLDVGTNYMLGNNLNLFLEPKFHNVFGDENLSYCIPGRSGN